MKREEFIFFGKKPLENDFDPYKQVKSRIEQFQTIGHNVDKVELIIFGGTLTAYPQDYLEWFVTQCLNAITGVDAKTIKQAQTAAEKSIIKNYINKVLKDSSNGRKKTEAIIKNMLIYGTSVVKTYWDTEPEMDVNPMDGQIEQVNSAHPNFDLIDPFCFAWDTTNESHDIKNCEWVRERIFISKEKMLSIRDNGECGPFSRDDMSQTENTGKKNRQRQGEESKDSDMTYYDEFSATFYSKDEQGKLIGEEWIAWLLAGNKIIKFIRNPQKQKMYSVVRAYENPNEFAGLGEADVVGALSAHLSYVHYQLGKLSKKVGQHLTIVTPAANISPENLRRIEEGVIFVDNKEGLAFEQTTDAQDLTALLKTKEYLDSQIEAVTGVTKALSGEAIGDITATQASLVFQNASNRLALKLTHLQEDLIKDLETIVVYLDQCRQTKIDNFI
jgi:hypothetical protein